MAKNKMKIKKSVRNRFRVTKKGKVHKRKPRTFSFTFKNSKRKLRRMNEPKQLDGRFGKKLNKCLEKHKHWQELKGE